MNTQKTNKSTSESVLKLDPLSNRYRICPNCKKQHMVKHLGKDFCSDFCADTHYNENRRLNKQAEAILTENKKHTSNETTTTQIVDAAILKSNLDPEKWGQEMENNIKILDGLSIDNEKGSLYHMQDLMQRGMNFFVYSDRGKLHNTSEKHDCHFLIFCKYRIYSIDYGKVLIVKEN